MFTFFSENACSKNIHKTHIPKVWTAKNQLLIQFCLFKFPIQKSPSTSICRPNCRPNKADTWLIPLLTIATNRNKGYTVHTVLFIHLKVENKEQFDLSYRLRNNCVHKSIIVPICSAWRIRFPVHCKQIFLVIYIFCVALGIFHICLPLGQA